MKYNENNKPIQCIMTNSTCYNGTTIGIVVGILFHSTGSPNPNLRRYVQPSPDDPNRQELLNLLGKNIYGNDWNNQPVQAGLNAWIGKMADGSVNSVQTLPLNFRPWGCGSGKYGSCNGNKKIENSPFWLQLEICEDYLNDKKYFDAIYQESIELAAYWCKLFNLNPFGTVSYNGVNVPVILDHAESYKLGLGSNHGDIQHWFKKYGKTLDDMRNDIYNLLQDKDEEEEEDDMTQERFNELMTEWLKIEAEKEPSSWSEEDRKWVEQNGIVRGDEKGRKMYKKFVTREEMAAMLHRANGID